MYLRAMLLALSTRARLRSAWPSLLLFILLSAASLTMVRTAHADVVVDDTLGAMATITGPDYVVSASHGSVVGDTLYLSFTTLVVGVDETLTINGPANVEHVVVRVTGGATAQFGGTVTLGIADASLIIASPAGLAVTEGGVFTVTGDLVLTTADYVRASSGDRFQVPPIASEDLPNTAPAHLGFLAGPGGSLVISDAGITLTGDLRVVAGSVTITDSSLEANHVALIGATLGEVALATLDLSSMSGMGTLSLADVEVTSEENELVRPVGCGNGWRDPGEACDDGPNMSAVVPDACRPGCIAPTCGDGIEDSTEECDLGASNSNTVVDRCRLDCDDAGCGDGVLDTGEICDMGAMNSDTTLGACRTSCTFAICGDGVRVFGEECDSGAANSDTAVDACRADCQAAGCGDDVIDTGEECDDGANNSAGSADACRDDCKLPSCGDRVVDTGEFCDDGPFNSDVTPERCRLDCQSANGPLELIGGACEVPRSPSGEWPLGAFVLAAVAILVPLRRRGS